MSGSTTKTKNKPDVKYSLEASGDLIIGQSFPLTITVNSTSTLAPTASIFIKNITGGIKFTTVNDADITSSTPVPFLLDSSQKIATLTIQCLVKNNASYGDKITFDISSNNIADFEGRNFIRYAKDINEDSLALIVDNVYLQSPYEDNKPTNAGTTKVHTVLLDQTHKKPLSDIPIFISSSQESQLTIFSYSSDPLGNNSSTMLPISPFNERDGFFINSAANGQIIFYVHAQASTPGKAQLTTLIFGIFSYEGYAPPIYSIYGGQPTSSDQAAWSPSILGYDPIGILIAEDNEKNFIVTIPKYKSPLPGDTVFFLVATQGKNPQYSGHYVTIKSPKDELGIPNFQLPYQIFQYGVESKLSYIIVRETGGSLISMPLPLTYMGGIPYSPEDGISRNYERCIVYTSLGVNEGVTIANNGKVNYDNIIKYPHGEGEGLFIKILGTNDSTNVTDNVPIGTIVTLNSYINSGNKNGITNYQSKEIATHSDGIYTVINIPLADLENIAAYSNRAGTIQLDYTFSYNGKIMHSKVWSAEIETQQ
ncbi:hypothetical protein FE392_02225 [Xenorhabdus sp. 12]|uniref:Inverse autotransporter beta-barrel domain-containing protein n=1 Tax=Xenorhabdus santafensis TaxID=2582833 RepID=A0ABU4S4L7_9GAMM|nr:hypothetical protein [Xenorhabdus sp. 12]MDX7986155.1 hypothetical protein [Xenorhabdus sp. 12]